MSVFIENEKSVYDKFVENIVFKDKSYEVKLPFKENQSMIEDNYNLSLKRLENLKRKLDKNPSLLNKNMMGLFKVKLKLA